MRSDSKSLDRLRRAAIILPVMTLLLVFAGGLVTSKGAGLAVPDWPTSYGGINPHNWWKIENVRAEHGHRLLAGVVGLLTLGFMIWTLGVEPRVTPRRFAVAAVIAVFVQALFGGWIVKSFGFLVAKLSHATLGQAFFCITLLFALTIQKSWSEPAPPVAENGFGLRWLALLFTIAVFIQLELGALMRHTGSGLAITDFPSVFGGLVPPSGQEALDKINQHRLLDLGLDPVNYPKIWVHYLHRAWAVAVFALGMWAATRAARRHADRGELLFPGLFIGGALVLQIILGAMIVLTGRQPHVATAHVAVGASILAAGVILTAQSFRLIKSRPAESHPGAASGAAPSPPPGASF